MAEREKTAFGELGYYADIIKRSHVIRELEAAGYRIIGPGSLDDETLERAAEVAWLKSKQGATHEQIATAIRNLKGGAT